MARVIKDISSEFGYYRLLESAEKARWEFANLDWNGLDESMVTDDLLHSVKAIAYGELTTFSATASFMKLFRDDLDFTQWLAVWFYEETKHPLTLIRWLAKLGVTTEEEFIRKGRQITPMTSHKVEMLTFNIISEITASGVYHNIDQIGQEPLLLEIARNLGRDEMRHSRGFEYYCERCIDASDDPDRERLRCLRSVWVLLQPANKGMTRHPVFLTLEQMRGYDFEQVRDAIEGQIVRRIGKILKVDIPHPGALESVYLDFKQNYLKSSRLIAPEFAADR